MVSINYATREVSCKIVYYGPGLSGKTTNLQYVHLKVPSNTKGKLISLATDADRTLYFDFLPINIGKINGFASKFQLYTVPGQVYYNATRKLVLRGVDGLVFVADSQPDKMDENIESLNNLKENLTEYGYKVDEMPIVIQYNKQDLPGVLSPEEMHPILNPKSWPEFKASATEGFGVFDTLKCILKLVLEKAKTGGSTPGPSPQVAESPTATPAIADTGSQAVPTPAAQPSPISRETVPQVQTESSENAEEDRSSTAPIQVPVAQAIDRQPEPVAVAAEPTVTSPPIGQTAECQSNAEPKQAYRPFPGNTLEDEHQMQQVSIEKNQSISPGGLAYNKPGQTAPVSGRIVDTEISRTAGSPRMAPSLKADRPKKKRSFFKRLFGLK